MIETEAPVASVWTPWQPTANAPWDLRRAVHLHRRTAFGTTWAEIDEALKHGLDATVDRLLKGQMQHRSPSDFAATAASLAEAALASRRPDRLKAWWIYRMLRTPDPLGEQLTLMWHNHFATSNLKVNDVDLMWRQNDTFRRLRRAPFGEMLRALLTDPALLIWLDAPTNRKGTPNENLARELMELFTLGIGNYTETDVKEAARALTGMNVDEGRYVFEPQWHDHAAKTILGRTGKWGVDDLVDILLEHPATAKRIAWRICQHFLGEENIEPTDVRLLAAGLRDRQLDVGWAVETVVRSARFFDTSSIGSRIVPPVDYAFCAARPLEQVGLEASTALLASWTTELGQDLFNPPNVGGWPGGQSWLSSRTMIGRTRFASDLADGRLNRAPRPLNIQALARQQERGTPSEQLLDSLSRLLFGTTVDPAMRQLLLSDMRDGAAGAPRTILTRLLASPLAQLG